MIAKAKMRGMTPLPEIFMGMTYGGDVESAERGDHLFERGQHGFTVYNDLGVLCSDVVRDLFCILQVYRVRAHADCKRAYGLAEKSCGHRAHQTAVQSAGEQEAERRVRVKTLFYPLNEFFFYLRRHRVQAVRAHLGDRAGICVSDKLPVRIIAPGRKRPDLVGDVREVLRLGGKDDASALRIAVKQRANSYRIARGDKTLPLRVIYHHGELRVELCKHTYSVFLIKRKNDLAVAVACESIFLF